MLEKWSIAETYYRQYGYNNNIFIGSARNIIFFLNSADIIFSYFLMHAIPVSVLIYVT